MDNEIKSPENENVEELPEDTTSNTSEEFDLDKYEQNLEDNSISDTELRYRNLIEKQDQLIKNLRRENNALKERNLSLATSVSTVDTTKPQTTEDILAKSFLL